MFYRLRVNLALAKLGVNPNHIRTDYRIGAQTVGHVSGNSPQEVALFIAAQLPIAFRMELQPGIAKGWIRERKINARDPEMKQALYELGWFELAEYG